MQRWKELPDPADFASELGLNLPQNEFEEETTFIHNQNSQRLGNVPMVNIIEDWRSKWKLGKCLLLPAMDSFIKASFKFALAQLVFTCLNNNSCI